MLALDSSSIPRLSSGDFHESTLGVCLRRTVTRYLFGFLSEGVIDKPGNRAFLTNRSITLCSVRHPSGLACSAIRVSARSTLHPRSTFVSVTTGNSPRKRGPRVLLAASARV